MKTERPTSRWWLLVGLLLILGAVGFFLAANKRYWIGSADLEIEFVVTDADTGRPVEYAVVQIEASEGASPRDQEGLPLELRTDRLGSARLLRRDCKSGGTSSFFGESVTVVPPLWRYYASAPGYRPADPEELYRQRVTELTRRPARMAVTIALRRAGP